MFTSMCFCSTTDQEVPWAAVCAVAPGRDAGLAGAGGGGGGGAWAGARGGGGGGGGGAGGADLPGAAAEQVARARAGARSSPCESAAPTRAQAPLPANPYRRVTRRRARPAAPAPVGRPQPEERAAQASAVRVVRARVPPALVPRVPVKRVPVARVPLPAPESVGCSSPEARSRGLQ